jgi:outer membrane protein assembly factor BamB
MAEFRTAELTAAGILESQLTAGEPCRVCRLRWPERVTAAARKVLAMTFERTAVRMHRSYLVRAVSAALLTSALSLTIVSSAVAAPPPCKAPPSASGEWPLYGHDVANSRDQASEPRIGPNAAASLSAAWVFSTGNYGDTSAVDSTPVVSGGCVFVGSTAGNVYAVDSSSGKLVWEHRLTVPNPGLGGALVGAAAVSGSEVIWLVNETGGPYAIALDRSTGSVVWQSSPLSSSAGFYTNASPTVANGMVVAGYSDPEGNDVGSGGFAVIDATTGALIKVTPVVSPANQAQGYAGGGLWDTPAFSRKTGFLYYGTGNPDSKTKQDPNTDAIVKIDLNRYLSDGVTPNPKFGEIVAAYPGNVDQYTGALQAAAQTPACSASDSSGAPWPLDDPVCGQLDLDFGASPNLFTDSSGNELVGDLQKAGVYHVANATTMAPVWHQVVGGPCAACNAGSTAFDGSSIDVVGTPGGTLFSLGRDAGALNWASPLGDGVHYQSTSTADGVVYAVDNNGFLSAFDASSGALLFKRQLSLDAGEPTGGGLTSNGVSIAEGEVLVAASSVTGSSTSATGTPAPQGPGAYVIAYR